uniref:Secreted protein n=1 Tax=Panagrellus redivivus TaxID=6233 RepID=A0A7E4UU97_PANRE
MTLLLAHHIHGDRLTPVNMIGLVLCLLGMSLHGAAKHSKKLSFVGGRPLTVSSPTSLDSASRSGFDFEDRKKLLDDV